jgi:RND family efflux transporter MFP subunit
MRRFLGVMLVAGLAACGGEHPAVVTRDAGPAVNVQVEGVRLAQVPVTVTAVGTTEPYARATPGTRLLGRVAEVTVDEGQRVGKGDVLVRIEGQDLAAKRQQAESGLREARAVLRNAETQAARIRNLYAEKAVPKQALDEAETAYTRAQAGVASAEGALKEIEANLGYTAVSSPLDGVVVRKFVEPGDMASPGAPLFTVEQQDSMKVTVDVSEQDLAYIQVAQPVQVSIESLESDAALEGDVETIIPSADPRSRTFQVRVVLDNVTRTIRSGMFARVLFQKDTRAGMLIPARAVVTQGQLQGVYVIDGNHARLRWVRLGKTFGDHVEVISGLTAGDRIAVSGMESLSDGRKVEVMGDA